jgi:hypothetical protein
VKFLPTQNRRDGCYRSCRAWLPRPADREVVKLVDLVAAHAESDPSGRVARVVDSGEFGAIDVGADEPPAEGEGQAVPLLEAERMRDAIC